MPSIQDVADQINAKLDSISVKTAETAVNTNNTTNEVKAVGSKIDVSNALLGQINFDIKDGFSNIGQGVSQLINLSKASLAVQIHQTRQNDTIICLLENSNEMLCGITRKLTRQLELSEASLASLLRIEGIEERVHSDAAADYDRHLAIEERMEECCPHPEEPVEPCPEACSKPKFEPPRVDDKGWKPLPQPKQPKPVDKPQEPH